MIAVLDSLKSFSKDEFLREDNEKHIFYYIDNYSIGIIPADEIAFIFYTEHYGVSNKNISLCDILLKLNKEDQETVIYNLDIFLE